MKRINLILAVLAVVLILCASIGAASAYFTTYADARGGYVIHMKYESEIEEKVEGNVKQVTISNIARSDTEPGTYPVFVRAKVFAGNDVNVSISGTNWTPITTSKGVYYFYELPLYSAREGYASVDTQSQTTTLGITVDPAENSTVRPGDPIDVLVTYESVPAVFTAAGAPDLETSWANGEATNTIATISG